jgi:hypothetical protein
MAVTWGRRRSGLEALAGGPCVQVSKGKQRFVLGTYGDPLTAATMYDLGTVGMLGVSRELWWGRCRPGQRAPQRRLGSLAGCLAGISAGTRKDPPALHPHPPGLQSPPSAPTGPAPSTASTSTG